MFDRYAPRQFFRPQSRTAYYFEAPLPGAFIRNSVGGIDGALLGPKASKSMRRRLPERSTNASLQSTAAARPLKRKVLDEPLESDNSERCVSLLMSTVLHPMTNLGVVQGISAIRRGLVRESRALISPATSEHVRSPRFIACSCQTMCLSKI